MGHKIIAAPRAVRGKLDASALVAHLVAQLDGIESTPKDIYEHLKGRLRWSLAESAAAIEQAIRDGLLSPGRTPGDRLTTGASYDPGSFPVELEAARRAAARAKRVPSIDRSQQRREMILAELSPRVARSTESLWVALGPSFGYRRKLERDLADLKKAGLVSRGKDGWLDAREQDFQLEQATVTALGLMLSLYDEIVPFDLQKRLRTHLEKAKRKLDALPSNDPGVRWLRALRITPPRHYLDTPTIRPNVKDVIEEAILRSLKIRIAWTDFDREEGERELSGIFSISHLLLEVPSFQRIDAWSDGKVHRIALSGITEARLLEDRAEYPPDYEPNLFPPQIHIEAGDANEHGGRSLVTLSVAPKAFTEMKQKKIGELLSEPIEGHGGWLTTSLRVPLDMPAYEYLTSLKDVAIIGPRFFRIFVTSKLNRLRAQYVATSDAAAELYETERRYESNYEGDEESKR